MGWNHLKGNPEGTEWWRMSSAPLTKLSIDPIFAIMGAVSGIKYEIKPLEIFILYPVMIIFVTIISASLTALYTRTIKASDTANIE